MTLVILLFVPVVLVFVFLLLVVIIQLQRKQNAPSRNQTQRRPDGSVNPLFRRSSDIAGTMGAAGVTTGAGLGLAAMLDQGPPSSDTGPEGGSPDSSTDSGSFDGGSSSFGD